jgi:hypothetical protein
MRTPRRLAPFAALTVAALLAAIAPAAAASPAAPAAGTSAATWYVAPGGPLPGPTQAAGGSCATPDRGSIQAAVDASGRGDTIIVCDGVYRETVAIEGSAHDGLTLIGASPWGATLLRPSDAEDLAVILVEGADDVTIQHLRIAARPTCASEPYAGIVVQASRRMDIRANRVVTSPTAWTNGCTFAFGITTDESDGAIRNNRVETWLEAGIGVGLAPDQSFTVRIDGNSLRFAPPRRPTGVTPFGIQAGTPSPTARFIVANNAVTIAPRIKGTASEPSVIFGIIVAGQNGTIRANRSTGSAIALLINGFEGFTARDNFARGLTTDCFGDVAQTWVGNDGRPWRSTPEDICRVGG